jgi:hypothetical protein
MKLSFGIFPSWNHLAAALTTEYLQKHGDSILPLNFRLQEKASFIFNKPLYEFNPKIEITDSAVELIIDNRHYVSNHMRFLVSIDVKIAIKLQRIAGHVGYKNAEFSLIDSSSQSFTQSKRSFGLNDNNTNGHFNFVDGL